MFDDNWNCITCAQKLNSPGCQTCDATGCLTCSSSQYYYDPNAKECRACSSEVAGCSSCVASTPCNPGSCTAACGLCNAAQNYNFLPSSPTYCKCISNQYAKDIDGICVPCSEGNPHCNTCLDLSPGSCIQCDAAYYLAPPVTPSSICKACDDVASGGYTGCTSCSYDIANSIVACTLCGPPYYFDGGFATYCRPCDDFCSACTAGGSCTACKTGAGYNFKSTPNGVNCVC